MFDTLKGKRVLIVEDEYFIAAELRDALMEARIEVVGPVGRLDSALELADGAIDFALIDVNLGGAHSYPIADRLTERNVPYIFVTGYDDWALPAAYRDAPRVAKPFDEGDVLARMAQLMGVGERA